jgi:hypothetical protein
MRENTANLSQCAANGCVRCLALAAGLSICLLLTGCDSAGRRPAQTGAAQPVLPASPNPVPAGDINHPLGTTTITWDTGNGAIGDLYVKVDRQPPPAAAEELEAEFDARVKYATFR